MSNGFFTTDHLRHRRPTPEALDAMTQLHAQLIILEEFVRDAKMFSCKQEHFERVREVLVDLSNFLEEVMVPGRRAAIVRTEIENFSMLANMFISGHPEHLRSTQVVKLELYQSIRDIGRWSRASFVLDGLRQPKIDGGYA